jgi:hypothetical protein
MAEPLSCPVCDQDVIQTAKFCPRCGVALGPSGTAEMLTGRPSPETRELLAGLPDDPHTRIHEAQRRPFGAHPAPLLGGLALASLVIAIVLIAAGVWVVAVIALGLGLGAIALFIPAIRHDPTAPTARASRRAAAQATATAGLVAVTARTWARAAVSLLEIKRRRVRLRRRLHRQMGPLGEAVYRGEDERAEVLKASAARLEQELGDADRQASAVVSRARERTGREKATVQPTQELPADPVEAGARSPRLARRGGSQIGARDRMR